MKRQCLEECYAKITEAARCWETGRQEVGRGAQDVASGDADPAEPYLDLGQDISFLNLELHCEMKTLPLVGMDMK